MTEFTASERESALRKIRALTEKTIENGCTEAEAMLAAAKVAALMDKFHLSMTDAQIREETIGTDELDTGFRKIRPVAYAVGGIARYCGVKIWTVRGGGASRKIRILGMESDSAFAAWLYKMIEGAISTECRAWRHDAAQSYLFGVEKKRAIVDFEVAMASRVGQRLAAMAAEREAVAKTASGTALVVVRNQLVEAAYDALKLKFSGSSGINARHGSAYSAGRAAGDRINLSRPLGSSAAYKRIG